MDVSRDTKREALLRAASCFQDHVFHDFCEAFLDGDLEPVILRAFDPLYHRIVVPISAQDFFTCTKHVFTRAFADRVRAKCAKFDLLCGEELADTYFGEHSVQEWTWIFVENTLRSFLEDGLRRRSQAGSEGQGKVDDGVGDRPDSSEVEVGGNSETTPRGSNVSSMPDALPSGNPEISAPRWHVPITQIDLKGPSIKEAWRNNQAIHVLTASERRFPRRWTPEICGGGPVYHGTVAHKDTASLEDVLGAHPSALSRTNGASELVPDQGVGAIGTKFSALSAWLRALFMAEIVTNPTLVTENPLNFKFNMRNQPFRGVLLVQFHSNQPAPQGLSHYEIPLYNIINWTTACRLWNGRAAGSNIWTSDCLREIHQEDTNAYPDIVHGREVPLLAQSLREFGTNEALFWQTAWTTPGAERALNDRINNVFAISFEFEEAQDEKKKKKQKKKGGLKRLKRKIREIASKMGLCEKPAPEGGDVLLV